MLKRSIAFLTCLLLVFPSSGYCWGNKGHQTVDRFAQLLLLDDNDLRKRLRVGSGYIDPEGAENSIVIALSPREIKAHDFPSDHGANHLLINGMADQDLHFHGDSDLGDLAANGASGNT